jgi:hypothetical protein
MKHMSRFNYEKIAWVFVGVFRQLQRERVEDTSQAKLVLTEMMKMLKADNSKFSREIFIDFIKRRIGGGDRNEATTPTATPEKNSVAQAKSLQGAEYARTGDIHP